jgi:sulfate transport system permease protein
MSGIVTTRAPSAHRRETQVGESVLVRVLLIAVALLFLAIFLVAPIATVFASAFSKGVGPYWAALAQDETIDAIKLTLLTAGISVPLNVVFGVAAAWLISKYDFWGKSVLITVVDLPFSVSPVISGLIFVLLFGAHGWFGPWLSEHDIKIIFAVPGIVMATTFVTFPLVARELIAVMQAQGNDEEEAALTLGASGLSILWRITLPKVRWGLIYGVILCNARAMGEFGAVSVVSGHVRGLTNTLPLQVEILYNEYNFVGAFAVASLLSALALVTLCVKKIAEWSVSNRQAKREASLRALRVPVRAATSLEGVSP